MSGFNYVSTVTDVFMQMLSHYFTASKVKGCSGCKITIALSPTPNSAALRRANVQPLHTIDHLETTRITWQLHPNDPYLRPNLVTYTVLTAA
jgi:hypothetical protein